MKLFITLAFLCCVQLAKATSPEYYSSKEWIIEHSPQGKLAPQDVIYVGCMDVKKGFIVRWTKDITIKDLALSVHYNQDKALVIILRSDNPAQPVWEHVTSVGSTFPVTFKKADVIWIADAQTAL